jgi:hypothetical protein
MNATSVVITLSGLAGASALGFALRPIRSFGARFAELAALALAFGAAWQFKTFGAYIEQASCVLVVSYVLGRIAADSERIALHLLPAAALATSSLVWGGGLVSPANCLLPFVLGSAAMKSNRSAALGSALALGLAAFAPL